MKNNVDRIWGSLRKPQAAAATGHQFVCRPVSFQESFLKISNLSSSFNFQMVLSISAFFYIPRST
jgi:hypothetical protein